MWWKAFNRFISSAQVVLLLFLIACGKPSEKSNSESITAANPLFTMLTPEVSGIDFVNNMPEDSVINYFTYPYIYMGGGVAVGDVNGDGLQDIYFTGNRVPNKLYLNRGDLKFEDITAEAQVAADDRWVTGVTMADVNADGLLDLYVSVSGKFATTKNLLYINQGVNENGIPTFQENAEAAGVADEGHSTQSTFFDYDKDGDLDLYVANYPYTSFKARNSSYRFWMEEKNPENSDRLFQNQGDGTFKDVSAESGVLNFGLALGIVTGDFNQDGWEDIYVSNDFASPDFFYFNNGDGTFSEQALSTMQHTAFFGMGVDAGDINNDGWLDIIQLDMTPEDNRRNKANMASMDPAGFYEIVDLGMHHQYMQNNLQLNNGTNASGYPSFSDIARITGVATTDWSWAGLFADLDNDGWKDIYITNGTRKDINNKDYFNKIDKASPAKRKTFDYVELSKNIPHERVDNYAFKNQGNLNFVNTIEAWGLSFEGYSNGAAYADLDNDGDLELIVNNIDDPSFIFKNQASEQGSHNYLRISLQGASKNPNGLGTEVTLVSGDLKQFHHHTLTRGFQSSVEPYVHFGLGAKTTVEELHVKWPDGREQVLRNVEVNQTITVNIEDASLPEARETEPAIMTFSDITKELGIDHLHQENIFNDYQYEVLLPHIYSQQGPALAVGDVNGDQLDDFFVGAAIGFTGTLYIQNQQGTFQAAAQQPWSVHSQHEDVAATMVDMDGDGDLDLYVASGGNEYPLGSAELQDRVYINNGSGSFQWEESALPQMLSSSGRVVPGDYDADGDLDLLVAGRIKPRAYPEPAQSYLLQNQSTADKVQFADVTAQIAPELSQAGLVTDARWLDFDGDQQLDLVLVGEWMPITFLHNRDGSFQNVTEDLGLSNTTGWWYSLAVDDFDGDGDLDLVAGNLGLNYKYQASAEESFDVYAYDYDKNGQLDIVLSYYESGTQYPVRGRQCSSQQIPAISVKYEDYNSFAEATLKEIYSDGDLDAALHYQAFTFASSYLENLGHGKFEIKALPNEAQLSNINGIVSDDFNGDGHVDMVVAGNMYGAEVETTRNDAGHGYLLLGDGAGNFEVQPYAQSGIHLPFDTKDIKLLNGPNGKVLVAANNRNYIKALKLNPAAIP